MLNVTSKKLPNRCIRVLTDLEILEVSGGRGIGRGAHRIRSQTGSGGLPTGCPTGQSMQLQGISVSTTSFTGSVAVTAAVLPSGTATANSPSTTIVCPALAPP